MIRPQLDGHVPTFDPAAYPLLRSAPLVTPGQDASQTHWWVRLIPDDLYLSCARCGLLRSWDDSQPACTGRIAPANLAAISAVDP